MNINVIFATFVCLLGSVKASNFYVTSDNGNRYFFQLNHVYNWYEAVHACARRDMNLLTIDTSEKNEEIFKLIKNSKMPMIYQFWIAAHDNAVNDQFEWLTTGVRVSFTQWMKSEPNSDAEHCVELALDHFQWNDVRCMKLRAYICEENRRVKEKDRELERLINEQLKATLSLVFEGKQKSEQLVESHEKQVNTLVADKKQVLDVLQKSQDEGKQKLAELNKQIEKTDKEIETYKKLEEQRKLLESTTTEMPSKKFVMSPWRLPGGE